MITLHKSSIHPDWVELRQGDQVLDEVEVRFRFRKMSKIFSTVEEARKFLEETESKQAKTYACYLLSARSYVSVMLAKKLGEKGYSTRVVEKTIEKLTELGLLEDAGWQKSEVERELSRGHGPRLIEAKWRAKGFEGEVRKYLTNEMQREKIQELWPKIFQKKKDKQKTIATLARRGFDLDLILSVCYGHP